MLSSLTLSEGLMDKDQEGNTANIGGTTSRTHQLLQTTASPSFHVELHMACVRVRIVAPSSLGFLRRLCGHNE